MSTIAPEQRHELETRIETIEFLSKQIERVQLSIADQHEELGRVERRLQGSIDMNHRRIERMQDKLTRERQKLTDRLEELKTSVVHHGKVYAAVGHQLIILPVDH